MSRPPSAITPKKRGRGPGRPFVKVHVRTGGMQKGFVSTKLKEIRELAQRLLTRPEYLKNLQARLDAGTAGPIEVTLHHYAWGKPKETVELSGAAGPVRFTLVLGAHHEPDVPELTDGSEHA